MHMYKQTSIYIYISPILYIHSYILKHTHIITYINTYIHTYIHTYIRVYIYMYTYIPRTYIIHTQTHSNPYVNVYIHRHAKIADCICQQIQNALNTTVNFTDKSRNVNKERKKLIHEAVNYLRNLIFILRSNLLEKTDKNNKKRN